MRTLWVSFLVLATALAVATAFGQKNLSGSAQIRLQLDKLNTVGSVLMIAAHPDDENTALLAYFARRRNVRTGYLSATRGEGGQNLIGPDQGDVLGVIRTQELLAARRIDGAEQFFTRAIDFGFTKTPEETMEKWGGDRVLSDMVLVIRRFRPDVVVLRFSGTPADGHGQHQASAILGKEAFLAAADPARYPELGVPAWKAKRLLLNLPGFTAEMKKRAEAEPRKIIIDTGEYNPLLGKSYGEIAALSRSEHRSQAMGMAEPRGPAKEYLKVIAGADASTDLFEGVDLSWTRIPGGAPIAAILADAARSFVPEDPALTIPKLLQARPLIAGITGNPVAAMKLRELDETVALCAGLWLDASTDRPLVVPGNAVKITLTAINRSKFPLVWSDRKLTLGQSDVRTHVIQLPVPAGEKYSQPFWLEHPKTGASYNIPNRDLIGRAGPVPYYVAKFHIEAGAETLELERPAQYRYVDPGSGELTRPLAIVPPVAVNMPGSAFLFPNGKPVKISVQVLANMDGASGEVHGGLQRGWTAAPSELPFQMAAGEQAELDFVVTPPSGKATSVFSAAASIGGKNVDRGMQVISYPHIPTQVLFPQAAVRAESFSVESLARKCGYIVGAGDQMPQAIEQLGCAVTILTAEGLLSRNLAEFDAIVLGVRAYNVRTDVIANQTRLMAYVRDGGTVIVQYNVLDTGFLGRRQTGALSRIGPYPLTVGKERVTVEESPVTFLKPEHPLLNKPNKITARDFEGWVQERGLYFPSQFDAHYDAVIATNDPGEKPLPGGLLYTRYGKGVFIYTSYAWFRQLPAGVPGAYRIFANFLSAGKVAQQ